MGREDPFEFFRQKLPHSQKSNISLEEERRDTRSKTQYPFFTFFPLILGILAAIFTLFLFVGIYSGIQGTVFFFARVIEEYSGEVLSANALTMLLGLFGAIISNKKKYPFAAIVLCFVVSAPLGAMYLVYLHPPAFSQEKAVSVAYQNVPASATIATLTVRWDRRSGPNGLWEVEFTGVNLTPEELGWAGDPLGSPSVILNLVGDSGLPESTFKTLLVNIDGRTGQVVSKTAAASTRLSSTGPPPRTIISP